MTLQLRGLRISRGGGLLLIADMVVEAGDCVVLVAPSGAGASSLAAATCGALPAAGEVWLGGRRLGGGPARRRHRGLAAVLPDLPPLRGCTVEEALGLASRGGRTPGDAVGRLPLLSGRMGLDCGRLSGGERQLLRVALAWLARAAALVLDGPTAGLAGDVAEAVRSLALEEAARGAAVLWLDAAGSTVPATPRWTIAGRRVQPAGVGEGVAVGAGEAAAVTAGKGVPEAGGEASRVSRSPSSTE